MSLKVSARIDLQNGNRQCVRQPVLCTSDTGEIALNKDLRLRPLSDWLNKPQPDMSKSLSPF